MPHGGIAHITEECFKKGQLDFYGHTTWIYWHPQNEGFNPDNWLPIKAERTRIGTSPKGSQWAKVNLPKKPSHGDFWAIKDLVEIPDTLESGEYVLSFRWDCQNTPQVWNSCANIQIV